MVFSIRSVTPKLTSNLGQGQAESWSLEHHVSHRSRGQGKGLFTHRFPRCVSTKLDQKQSS